jgi:hypothetical protein
MPVVQARVPLVQALRWHVCASHRGHLFIKHYHHNSDLHHVRRKWMLLVMRGRVSGAW